MNYHFYNYLSIIYLAYHALPNYSPDLFWVCMESALVQCLELDIYLLNILLILLLNYMAYILNNKI
jgi:hypothetical protein